jgi:hypothetical protein
MNDFITMTELGVLFGETSHVIGKWLVAIGLRTPERRPSAKAFEGRYCQQAPLDNCNGYFYVWHRQRTIAALEAAGHRRVEQQSQEAKSIPATLVGPFTTEQSGSDTYVIRNGAGVKFGWIVGKRAAWCVAGLLNMGDRHGLLD